MKWIHPFCVSGSTVEFLRVFLRNILDTELVNDILTTTEILTAVHFFEETDVNPEREFQLKVDRKTTLKLAKITKTYFNTTVDIGGNFFGGQFQYIGISGGRCPKEIIGKTETQLHGNLRNCRLCTRHPTGDSSFICLKNIKEVWTVPTEFTRRHVYACLDHRHTPYVFRLGSVKTSNLPEFQ